MTRRKKTQTDPAAPNATEQNENEQATAAPDGRIPVRAKKTGYYDNARRRAGAEFSIASEKELGSWMERLDTKKAEEPSAEPDKTDEIETKDESVI